jgi:hypothetical protein
MNEVLNGTRLDERQGWQEPFSQQIEWRNTEKRDTSSLDLESYI